MFSPAFACVVNLLELASTKSRFFRYFLEGITTFVSLLLPYFTTRRFVHLLRSRVPARLLLLRFRYATFVFFVIFIFVMQKSMCWLNYIAIIAIIMILLSLSLIPYRILKKNPPIEVFKYKR